MIFVAKGSFCQQFADKSSFRGRDHALVDPQKGKKKEIVKDYFRIKENKEQVFINYSPAAAGLSPAFCRVIAADFYVQNVGFFCKKELQFEKVTKIPFRFRLGSLQYNDYLEQKPNAVNPF
ncbi:MAG: hypothetical protein KTQ13_03335 [Ferruginibacter sp.]|nr:hypothetical protein [Chitinophagaceae bacterium]MBP6285661.1 hypothetical protein [Ferruginibacter sp.]MBU9935660.1 hypothetical protein [Ferruginibacter sp.]